MPPKIRKAKRLAAVQRPDLIWVATVTDFGEAKTRPDIGGSLMGYRGRLTIAIFDERPNNADEIEYLRRLASTHGGKCIGADGKEVELPKPLPAVTPTRPVQANPDTRPSIFDQH